MRETIKATTTEIVHTNLAEQSMWIGKTQKNTAGDVLVSVNYNDAILFPLH